MVNFKLFYLICKHAQPLVQVIFLTHAITMNAIDRDHSHHNHLFSSSLAGSALILRDNI